MHRISKLFIPVVLLLPMGCTWVKLTPDGERVRVATEAEVGHCQRLGKTTSSGVEKVLAAKRLDDVVARELRDMARNSAAELGGDTIVPLTPIYDGKQQFAVYKCQ